ncbi:MAG TPA: PQQ-binding-like beta-propeller repeat protein [Candidatus Baltobacteraceae bacterium]
MRAATIAALLVAMLGACDSHKTTAYSDAEMRAAAPAVPTGDITTVLQVVHAPALTAARAQRSATASTLPPTVSASPAAAAAGKAYYFTWVYGKVSKLVALDLATGHVRWIRAINAAGIVASRDNVYYSDSRTGALIALDARTGDQRFTLPSTQAGGSIDGVAFARTSFAGNNAPEYSALDEASGHLLWSSHGGGMSIEGAPISRDGLLLQSFTDSGAIMLDRLYALDVKTGQVVWAHNAQGLPLGYRAEIAYLNATWFPEQMDGYVPMTIDAVDISNGKTIDSFTYAPDAKENAADYRSAPLEAFVTGGYIFLTVNHSWYRYDADRVPAKAHPYKLPGLSVEAAFENGSVLVGNRRGSALARSLPDRLELRAVGAGALRSEVATSANGSRYAVIGSLLYAFNSAGAPRVVGPVRCSHVDAIIPWTGNVAVLCADHARSLELRFTEVTRQPPPLEIAPIHIPYLRGYAYTIPSRENFAGQWEVRAVAPRLDNGVTFALIPGPIGMASAIGSVSTNGHFSIVRIGRDITIPPPSGGAEVPAAPLTVVRDRHGTTWFNDVWHPATITALDSSGHLRMAMQGEGPARRRMPIRLTIGPDGEAWYARSHPRNIIGRADGSRTFSIPAAYGDALELFNGSDGALWFITQTTLGRMTMAGAFNGVPIAPSALSEYSPALATAGSNGTVWLAQGRDIIHMTLRGPIGDYELPDATLSASALASGCDGALYVAENAPEVLRLPPAGRVFERYAIDYPQLDGLARTPDCALWFIDGSAQRVGTFLLPR